MPDIFGNISEQEERDHRFGHFEKVDTEQNLTDFEEKYKPVINHLDNNASFDGHMFETYDEEIQFVKNQNINNVWTICEEEDIRFISNGLHLVNRLGFFVTEVPWIKETFIEI